MSWGLSFFLPLIVFLLKKIKTKQPKTKTNFSQWNTFFGPTRKLVNFFFVRRHCFPVLYRFEFYCCLGHYLFHVTGEFYILSYTEDKSLFHEWAASICGFIIQIRFVYDRRFCLKCYRAFNYWKVQILLKCHCDEIFRIHCFCIFWIFKWYLLTCPSRFVQQAREDGFFYGFSRTFFGRHY